MLTFDPDGWKSRGILTLLHLIRKTYYARNGWFHALGACPLQSLDHLGIDVNAEGSLLGIWASCAMRADMGSDFDKLTAAPVVKEIKKLPMLPSYECRVSTRVWLHDFWSWYEIRYVFAFPIESILRDAPQGFLDLWPNWSGTFKVICGDWTAWYPCFCFAFQNVHQNYEELHLVSK